MITVKDVDYGYCKTDVNVDNNVYNKIKSDTIEHIKSWIFAEYYSGQATPADIICFLNEYQYSK